MRAITELAQWASDRESNLRFHEIERGELRLENGCLRGRSQSWSLADDWTRLADAVGAPAGYLKRLDGPVRGELLAHHINRGDHFRDGNVLLAEEYGHFVGFVRSDLHNLGVSQVLDAVSIAIGDAASSIFVRRHEWRDHIFEFDIVSPKVEREVSAGDVLQAGLSVRHSSLGQFATTVEGFVFRLVCRNGLVRRECVRRGTISRTRRMPSDHTHAEELQVSQIRDLAMRVWEQLPEQLVAIERLTVNKANAQDIWLQYLSRSRMVSKKLRESLRAAWEQEGAEESAYGAMNALSHAATHDQSLTRTQRQTLSRLAGILANSATHICPHCFSVVAI